MSNYDSDEDYEDVGERPFEEEEEYVEDNTTENTNSHTNKEGKRVRGKDIEWEDFQQFENAQEFKESEIYQTISKDFVCRKKSEPNYADTEHFNCKFARKVGYLPCQFQLKVNFLSTCNTVIVQTAKHAPEHKHVEDPDHQPSGNFFKWTAEQTNMVFQGVRNEAKPKVIRRNMREANLFVNGREPTSQQLSNKISSCRNLIKHTEHIFTTHELREKIKTMLEVPE